MKNIIITGTSSGIGLELVKIYSKSGYKVISLSRSDLPAKGLIGVEHMNFDISKKESLVNLVNLVKNKYKKIDILINNAGKLINKSFKDLSKDDLYDIYDVNVFGVISLIQCLLPFFKKDSHIVNISSIGGINGSSKFPGLSSYSSSKGALNILTEVLAVEFDKGPYVNSLSLGAVQTPMLELAFPDYKAPTTPEEMAIFIYNFSTASPIMFNGKVIPVSISNP